MQHYTVQDILALRPCQPTEYDPDAGYPEGKLRILFGDRRSVTALDICDDERVPVEDRQWVLHRLLPAPLVHEAACRYAEHALELERAAGREPDPRSWAAIAVKRRWPRGEISGVDLCDARLAAWDAVDAVSAAGYVWVSTWTADAEGAAEAAANAAAIAAAITAVGTVANAADAAVWDAARTAERQWQLSILREMIAALEDRTQQQGETS